MNLVSQVMGCTVLDAQLRKAHSSVHIFGHSHLRVDSVKAGVRYKQHALGSRATHTRGSGRTGLNTGLRVREVG